MNQSNKKLETVETAKVRNEISRPKQGIQRKYWVFRMSVISDLFDRDVEIKTSNDIISLLKTLKAEYVFQTEAGKESDYLHFQGSITLPGKGMRYEQLAKVLKGAWLEPSDSKAADKYASKTDTRIDGPFMWPYRYLGEDLPKETDLYDWQRNIISIIDGPVDDRQIIWVHQTTGNAGKSKFCKYIAYHYEGTVLIEPKMNDAAFALTEAPKVSRPIVLIDIAKAEGDNMVRKNALYTSLEKIKNGHFFSGKFESKQYLGPPPHVIVFSNELPILGKMSLDRWKIIKVE